MSSAKLHRLRWIGLFLVAALLGGSIALFAGLMMVSSGANDRLKAYAAEFLAQDERIAVNIDETLAAGNASVYPSCSDGDLSLLRVLLFKSPYLKDVGRTENGALVCSAVTGKLPQPVKPAANGVTHYQSREIYYNVELEMAKGHKAEVVVDGKTNVVVSPDIFADFSRPPMSFAGAIVDLQKHEVLQMYTDSPTPMPLNLLFSDLIIRKNGTLYLPKCSATRPDCVLIALPMQKVWAPAYPLLAGSFAIGAVVGIAFAMMAYVINQRQRSLGSRLRRAVRRKELSVLYQPIVDLQGRRTMGCEALVRWKDEEGNSVRPDVFIAIAEQEGFVGEITAFVISRVAEEIGEILRTHSEFTVSINMSALDLVDINFLPHLKSVLRAEGVPASTVGFELTERSTADREVVVKVIRELRSLGHEVYIDDFGTGYSNLSYLHELSVDVLKIDRSFTNTIGTGSITASIVPQIIAMAQALGLKTVVEGVETEGQAAYLKTLDMDVQVQGWLFGRPLAVSDLRKRLKHEGSSIFVAAD